jgi:deoxyribodipyrimidine photo-lyase
MKVALWWIRRDLRLSDNEALSRALTQAEWVIPVFILDPALTRSRFVGEKRLAFLYAGLRQLDADLKAFDSRLIVRRGEPVEVFRRLFQEDGAEVIFAEEDYSPYASQRDARVKKDFPLHFYGRPTLCHPLTVRKADGEPYTIFTPYRRAWEAQALPVESDLLHRLETIRTPTDIESEDIPFKPALSSTSPFPPGEGEAQNRLHIFVDGEKAPICRYADQRDRMDLEGTSQLSPYLRFGMLSARQAVVAVNKAIKDARRGEDRRGALKWLDELLWREFYHSILFNFPFVRKMSFRETLRDIRWTNDEGHFKAWCTGQTGYPIVDAAMRQLQQTGWMHNRARMIAASFLVKNLLIDWRWGEQWFMQNLLDGEPAANNGGWQWSAGTGADAAPYFRIFNPILQGKKYDPDGYYVRRWVPELSSVPDQYIHNPWKLPPASQETASCIIGKDYPQPIIDHRFARERALEQFRAAKQKAGG